MIDGFDEYNVFNHKNGLHLYDIVNFNKAEKGSHFIFQFLGCNMDLYEFLNESIHTGLILWYEGNKNINYKLSNWVQYQL